eukprot:10500253-Lingulodinium_polyedra.AAC.1
MAKGAGNTGASPATPQPRPCRSLASVSESLKPLWPRLSSSLGFRGLNRRGLHARCFAASLVDTDFAAEDDEDDDDDHDDDGGDDDDYSDGDGD